MIYCCFRYDERVRNLLDFSVYLDISNGVKFAWRIQVSCVENSPFVQFFLPFVTLFRSAERYGRAWTQP
jgi:uridine kinase